MKRTRENDPLGVIFDEFKLSKPLLDIMQHCEKQEKPFVVTWHRHCGKTAKAKRDMEIMNAINRKD